MTQRNTFLFAIILYFCVLALFLIMNRVESSVYGLKYKIVKENRIIDESTSRKIDLNIVRNLQNHFDVKWSGFFYAPATRLYPIQGAADDRLELRIDGNVALLRDATRGHSVITRFIPLQRGFHRIEADYSQFTGDQSLMVMMNHSLQALEFIDPPAFFPQIPSRMQLWVARLVTFLRGLLLFYVVAIPVLAIIAYSSRRSPHASQHSFVRVMRICIPTLIILYAALLRFEALTIKHGVVSSPVIVRVAQEHSGFVRYLHPKTLQWIPGSNPYEKGDPINYLRMARAMKSFYAAQFREPFYVFVVKQFLRFFDQKDIAVSFASAFFSVLCVFATFLLAQYAFSWWVGVLASLGMAIDSELISIGADGWRDDTFMFLVLMFSYALLRLFRKVSFGNALFAGIVAGLVCLTRMTSFSFILPGYLFVLLAGKEPSMKNRARSVLLSASMFCIIIAPFLINCAIVYGDPLFSVNDNTKFYRSRENIPAEKPKTVALYLTEKLVERPYKFIDTGFVGLTRYPFLNKWKGFNYLSPFLSKILAGFALLGTILFLFSSHGRLLLVLLISSLIPYAFTYEIAGGSEWRFTMHAYAFYMIAGALFLIVASGALCIQNTWPLFSERALSKKSVLLTSGIVLFVIISGWFLFNQSNFLRKKEAIMADEAILIESGQRDFRFFNSGWFPAVESVRITKDAASGLSFPLKAAKEYNLILRANPVFEKAKPSSISVFVNDRSAGQIEVKETVDSAYVLRLPQDFVKDGINQIDLRTNPESPNIALQYYKLQPVEAFQRAMDKYEKNEFDEAIRLFEQAAQQAEKRRAPVFYYLGMCYLKKDQPAKAIEYFNKALPLSRGNQQILEARGEAYLKTKQYDAATKDLTKVLKSQPNNENVKRLLSLARESRLE